MRYSILSYYLERKFRNEGHETIIIKTKSSSSSNTYPDPQTQRGTSRQRRRADTSGGSLPCCLWRRTILMRHLSYKALFSLESSGKDIRTIYQKKNEWYFHSVFILVYDKVTVKCIKYNYRLHSLEGKLLSSKMTFSFYFKYLPEKDA